MKTAWLAMACWFSVSVHAEPLCLATCIEHDEAKTRVVALNWSAAEMLLTLGVEPLGAPQINGYRKWQTNHPPMGENVVDIGRRQEPNLAAIARLKPDLIVGYHFRHQRLLPQLSKIAPTLLYRQYPAHGDEAFNYLDQSLKVFAALAQATGKDADGERVTQALLRELASLRAGINASQPVTSQPVTYAKFVGMGYGLRVFGGNSLAGQVATQIGLEYHWHHTLPGKDFTHLTIEQLPELDGSLVILAGDQSKSDYITQSPVWQTLPFVREQQMAEVAPLWSFGGPVSIGRMARAFAAAVQAHQERDLLDQSELESQEANDG